MFRFHLVCLYDFLLSIFTRSFRVPRLPLITYFREHFFPLLALLHSAVAFKAISLKMCLCQSMACCCSASSSSSSSSSAFFWGWCVFHYQGLTALSRVDVCLSPSNGAWQPTRCAQHLRESGLLLLSASAEGKRPITLPHAFSPLFNFTSRPRQCRELDQAPMDKFHVQLTWWKLTKPCQDLTPCWLWSGSSCQLQYTV